MADPAEVVDLLFFGDWADKVFIQHTMHILTALSSIPVVVEASGPQPTRRAGAAILYYVDLVKNASRECAQNSAPVFRLECR